ncbi:MAG: hypothetical protein IPK12_19785 [Gemmatimonadetes bacterium]|nr:hypothetical protein [Gemmatimonadota bacterium]
MRSFAVPLCLSVLLACKPADTPKAEPVTPPTPATVARADFSRIAYLAGRWRGEDAGGKPFFERYVALNDTTLQSYTFNDSSFAAPSDSGKIRWANGQVRSGSGQLRWVATVWTADSVRFEPEGGATNSFTWLRRSADAWTARLEPSGGPGPVVYEMTRLPE